MMHILVMLTHKKNEQLLVETISRRYEVTPGEHPRYLNLSFDLCILDGPTLHALKDQVRARKRAEGPYFLPFLLVTTRREIGLASRSLWEVVDEIITLPIEKLELWARIEALLRTRRLSIELRQMVEIDSLTGLFNRHYFFQRAEQEFLRYQRYRHALSAMMIDLDHFKRVNDTYGHLVGDQVLQSAGRRIRSLTRASDLAGRYGGEEFALLLPHTDLEGASTLAKRLHATFQQPMETSKGPISVTASIGIALATPELTSVAQFLEECDQALYLAKENGRNCIWINDAEFHPLQEVLE